MAREQQRIGSTNLYTARALTCEYATWRDQPQLVPTAEGDLKTISLDSRRSAGGVPARRAGLPGVMFLLVAGHVSRCP